MSPLHGRLLDSVIKCLNLKGHLVASVVVSYLLLHLGASTESPVFVHRLDICDTFEHIVVESDVVIPTNVRPLLNHFLLRGVV